MSPLDLALDFDRPYGALTPAPDLRHRGDIGPGVTERVKPQIPSGRPRSRTFKVAGRFDGKRQAKVIMTKVGDDWLVEVRPRGRRKTATGMLSVLAAGILFDAAKKAVAEKRKARKAKRHGN